MAALDPSFDPSTARFRNALTYSGALDIDNIKHKVFNQAMQYVSFENNENHIDLCTRAARRCSLVHAIYQVVCWGDSNDELCQKAIDNGYFREMYKGGAHETATWAFRFRRFTPSGQKKGGSRSSPKTRSVSMERQTLKELRSLLLLFGGGVDLTKPDCKIYIMDGLGGDHRRLLARQLAPGPQV